MVSRCPDLEQGARAKVVRIRKESVLRHIASQSIEPWPLQTRAFWPRAWRSPRPEGVPRSGAQGQREEDGVSTDCDRCLVLAPGQLSQTRARVPHQKGRNAADFAFPVHDAKHGRSDPPPLGSRQRRSLKTLPLERRALLSQYLDCFCTARSSSTSRRFMIARRPGIAT